MHNWCDGFLFILLAVYPLSCSGLWTSSEVSPWTRCREWLPDCTQRGKGTQRKPLEGNQALLQTFGGEPSPSSTAFRRTKHTKQTALYIILKWKVFNSTISYNCSILYFFDARGTFWAKFFFSSATCSSKYFTSAWFFLDLQVDRPLMKARMALQMSLLSTTAWQSPQRTAALTATLAQTTKALSQSSVPLHGIADNSLREAVPLSSGSQPNRCEASCSSLGTRGNSNTFQFRSKNVPSICWKYIGSRAWEIQQPVFEFLVRIGFPYWNLPESSQTCSNNKQYQDSPKMQMSLKWVKECQRSQWQM